MEAVRSITTSEAYAVTVDFLSGKVWPRTLGIVAVSSLAVAWQFWRKRLQQLLPPGSFGWPFLGQTLAYMKHPSAFIKQRFDYFGGTFKSHVLLQPVVVPSPTPENLKFLIKESYAGWPATWELLLGKSSIVMVNGELHTRIRKESTRAFTDDMLNKYLEMQQWYTETNLSLWASRDRDGGRARDILRDCKLHAFAVAQQALLGVKMSASDVEKFTDYFTDLISGFTAVVPIDLPCLSFGKAMSGRRALLKEYKVALDKRKAALDAGAQPECMIDTMLVGAGMNETELLDFVITMLFAAYDTSTVSMNTLLHFLKSLPRSAAIEAELRAEVDAAWDGVCPITRQTLKQAPKVQAFILESLRTVPPVAAIFRRLQKDSTVDGYSVPKGFTILGGLAAICHRLGDNFDFARHLDADGQCADRVFQVDAPSFGAFGMGTRHCIGHRFARDELAIFMLVLLRKYDYRLESSVHEKFPFGYWRCTAAFMERSKGK